MGTKLEEGRGLLTDNLIGMSLEDWTSPAREICCSNIKQQVRVEAALDPAVSRKNMSTEAIAHILYSLQNTFFFFCSVNSMLQG